MLWFVSREAALVFAVGLPLGLVLTFGTSRFLGSLLYEMSALDPRIHLAAVLASVFAGLLASYLPVRRATRIDPILALRYE